VPDGLTHGDHFVIGRRRHGFEPFKITACAEEAASATEGKASDGAVVLQGIADALQVRDDLVGQGVAALRLIKPDGQPSLMEFAFDRVGME
jgi:hypothetical protein